VWDLPTDMRCVAQTEAARGNWVSTMSELVATQSFHERLVGETITERLSERDAMLLFQLLHSSEIEVERGVVRSDGRVTMAAITQRHAGEVIASLFRNRRRKSDDHRASSHHWYSIWNGDWESYRHEFDDDERGVYAALASRLTSHPWVVEIREEV
jgi:hypothetical protein